MLPIETSFETVPSVSQGSGFLQNKRPSRLPFRGKKSGYDLHGRCGYTETGDDSPEVESRREQKKILLHLLMSLLQISKRRKFLTIRQYTLGE